MPRKVHQPYRSKLIEKMRVSGLGLGGKEVSCYKIIFSCDECLKEHTRFIYSKPEFEKYNLESIWKWSIGN